MNNQTSSLENSHFPVMLNEILRISSPLTKKKFIDCTFGGGGYSKKILNYSQTNVQAIDRDKKVYSRAKEFEKKFPNLKIMHTEICQNYWLYLASGGLNFKQIVPNSLLPLIRLTQKLTTPIDTICGLHHIIVLQKK